IKVFKKQQDLRSWHIFGRLAPAEPRPVNHLLVRAVGSKVAELNVSGKRRLSWPNHERFAPNGQLTLLRLATNHIIAQALFAHFEEVRMSAGPRPPVHKPI